MEKTIALKFADPLVKGLPLAYQPRIYLSDCDGQSSPYLEQSTHFAQSPSSTKQCDLCTLAHYFVYSNTNCFKLWQKHLFLM